MTAPVIVGGLFCFFLFQLVLTDIAGWLIFSFRFPMLLGNKYNKLSFFSFWSNLRACLFIPITTKQVLIISNNCYFFLYLFEGNLYHSCCITVKQRMIYSFNKSFVSIFWVNFFRSVQYWLIFVWFVKVQTKLNLQWGFRVIDFMFFLL